MTWKVNDFFAGCGGLSLGFDYLDQDFELQYALDNWEVACKIYKANFPYVDVDCRDALEIKPSELPKADVIIGGPPCQEFTIMKARKLGKFTPPERTFETALIDWFLQVVEYHKPKFWLMENVPPVKDYLPNGIQKKVYYMKDYGVPQGRPRLFAGIYKKPSKETTTYVFPTVINESGGFTYRPPNVGVRLGSIFRRRALLLEGKLVQTFPLDYVLCGTIEERWRQLANAVPPLMAYKFAEALARPRQQILSVNRSCVHG